MAVQCGMTYHFANCSIDPDKHRFERNGDPVHIEPQVFALLLVLAQRQGQLVTKNDLVEIVWEGLSISDATISARINAARKAVGDTGKQQAVIKTVHGRGFQLVAAVTKTPKPVSTGHEVDRGETQTIRFAQSSQNAKVAYSQSGNGPDLVRVGHWLSHLELDWHCPVWRPLINALGQHHTLYRYDQRGTGLSSRDVDFERTSLDDFAADLKAVADANNLDRFPIFAASQAVPVAIKFAQRYPERVSGLVLYGGYAQGRAFRPAGPDDIDEDTILALIRAGWGKANSPFVNAFSSLFMPDATAEQMDSFVKMQTETIAPENAAQLRQVVDRFDVKDILDTVTAPTLVMHGAHDAVHPCQQGQMLAAGIANARYVSLESRNHVPLPQEASWTRMFQEVETFLYDVAV